MRRRLIVAVIVVLVVAFFFAAPVIYSNDTSNHAGHSERYDSLSCLLVGAGVSYGYDSFLGNNWVLRPTCMP